MRLRPPALAVAALLLASGCRDVTHPGRRIDDRGVAPSFLVTPTALGPASVSASYAGCAVRSGGEVSCWGPNNFGEAPATRTPVSGRFVSVTMALYHTCALRDDGVAECWGQSTFGEAPATKTAASGVFTQISTGLYHTCAVRDDGVVECWGSNGQGRAPATRSAASGAFTQVTAAGAHSCALRDDGVIECWGENGSGQAPTGDITAGVGSFTQVTAGLDHTCALRGDGVIECWGANGSGQAPASVTASSGGFVSVDASEASFTCAVNSAGVAECWGDNSNGQAPATVPPSSGTFVQVAAGMVVTCGIRSDGVIECWGNGAEGATSPGSPPATPTGLMATSTRRGQVNVSWSGSGYDYRVQRAVRVSIGTYGPWIELPQSATTTAADVGVVPRATYRYRVRACTFGGCSAWTTAATVQIPPQGRVASSSNATCALRPDGQAECWGEAALGLRTASTGTFQEVNGGGSHFCALRSGTAECWGDNSYDQAPVSRTAGSGTFVQISAGSSNTCATRSDGMVECWGSNDLGQSPAVTAATTGSFVEVSAGDAHACGRRDDGALECWGLNTSGEAPVLRTAAVGRYAAVSAGYVHTCALRTDGAVECFGNPIYQPQATHVASTGTFVDISTSTYHSCATRDDGVAECWGTNSWQQAPATVANEAGEFVEVTTGLRHSCGRVRNLHVKCWGLNANGQAWPYAPSILTSLSAFTGTVDLSWDTPVGATQEISRRRSSSPTTSWETIAIVPWHATGYRDTGVPNGSYYYRINGCFKTRGCTPWSERLGQTLPPVQTLNVADYCVLQYPASASVSVGTPTTVYGRVYEAGRTPTPGPDAGIRAQIGYGPVGTDPHSAPGWLFTPDIPFNIQDVNNDEYWGQISPKIPGTYSYVVRFAIEQNGSWTYCDLNGSGSNSGLTFDVNQLGTLTVTP